MPVIVPPGYIQVNYRFTQGSNGHACTNTMGYSITGGITQANADTISTTIAPYYKAVLVGSGHYDGLQVIVGNDGPYTEYFSTAGNGVGTKSAGTLTPQCMAVLAKTTALRGRKYRGRCFVGDVDEAQVLSAGTIQSSELALYNALAAHLNSALGLGSLIGASYILHSDTTAPTLLASMGCDVKVGTLRKRYKR